MMSLHGLILLSIISYAGSQDLSFPSGPGVVYSPLNRTATIPCDLTFPENEEIELLMWSQGGVYVVLKGKDGQIKHRDPSVVNKFNIVGANNSLNILNVRREDGGNYTCRKSFKKLVNGDLEISEEEKSTELIVQDLKNLSLSEEIDDYDVIDDVIDENVTISDGEIDDLLGCTC